MYGHGTGHCASDVTLPINKLDVRCLPAFASECENRRGIPVRRNQASVAALEGDVRREAAKRQLLHSQGSVESLRQIRIAPHEHGAV